MSERIPATRPNEYGEPMQVKRAMVDVHEWNRVNERVDNLEALVSLRTEAQRKAEAERDALDLENDSLSDRVENLELALRGARSERDALKREMEARELHHFEAEDIAAGLAAQLAAIKRIGAASGTDINAWNKAFDILDADPAAVLAERDARVSKQALLDALEHAPMGLIAVGPGDWREAIPVAYLRARAEQEATE